MLNFVKNYFRYSRKKHLLIESEREQLFTTVDDQILGS